MNISVLSTDEQNSVVYQFTVNGISQTDIARAYGVSRRTIQRVLESYGVITYNYGAQGNVTPITASQFAPSQTVPVQHRMNFKTKVDRVTPDSQVLNRKNVEAWLTEVPHSQLTSIIHQVTMNKLDEVREILNYREQVEKEVVNA